MGITNPHFDENKLYWDDSYSGCYEAPESGYAEQFNLQWRLANERVGTYYESPGSSTDDDYIDDRIYEWTARHPTRVDFMNPRMGSRVLDMPIDPNLIAGKRCIDLGCGMGRWTRVMQRLGAAEVLSVDMSESGLASVQKYNTNTLRADVMTLMNTHPELRGQFDFGCFWGVAMCTHDPLTAFLNAAATIKPGGSLYLMVYCPEGQHASPFTNEIRKLFWQMKNVEDRISFVDRLYQRSWNWKLPFLYNLKNQLFNLIRKHRGYIIGVMDLCLPFYNWVIPLDVIGGWCQKGGFSRWEFLNESDGKKCAYHILFRK